MNCKTQVIAAAGIGYLLGRQHKLRWGLALAAAAAAGRFSKPGDVLQRGLQALTASPELGRIAKLGAPLVSAGKDAARAAVTGRIDSMSDRLRDRADLLRHPGGGRQEQEEPPDEEEEERRRPATRRDDTRPQDRPRRRARAAREDRYEEDESALDERDDLEDEEDDEPVSRSRPQSRPPVHRRGR